MQARRYSSNIEALPSFPPLFDFAAHPLRAFALVPPAPLLLAEFAALPQAVALDAQNPIHGSRTLYMNKVVIEQKM
jgi:hypothetical protein